MVKLNSRPRTTTPSDEKVIELGQKLVAWATEKDPEDKLLRSRFCEWYTLPEIGMIRNEWEALIKLNSFRVYYERARAALGRRFIDGTINPSIGHRLMWHYVPEAKEQEIEKMEKEAELKKKYETPQSNTFIFKSNIPDDNNNPLKISSKNISTSDTPSSE